MWGEHATWNRNLNCSWTREYQKSKQESGELVQWQPEDSLVHALDGSKTGWTGTDIVIATDDGLLTTKMSQSNENEVRNNWRNEGSCLTDVVMEWKGSECFRRGSLFMKNDNLSLAIWLIASRISLEGICSDVVKLKPTTCIQKAMQPFVFLMCWCRRAQNWWYDYLLSLVCRHSCIVWWPHGDVGSMKPSRHV